MSVYESKDLEIADLRGYIEGCSSLIEGEGLLASKIIDLLAWKEAVIEAAVVNWTYTAGTEKDPRKAINDLMCYAQQIALDPAVSSEAKHLYDRIKELEDLLLELNDQHELGFLGIEALTRSAERALNKFYDAINQLKDRE